VTRSKRDKGRREKSYGKEGGGFLDTTECWEHKEGQRKKEPFWGRRGGRGGRRSISLDVGPESFLKEV